MRLSSLVWIGLSCALAAAVSISSCGGVAGKYCTMGQTECVGSGVARTCASDGTWVTESCGSGDMCMAGSCASINNMSCSSINNTCTDSTHAIVCNSNGVGFKSVACPTGTTCTGLGECVGTCIVGESTCNGTTLVQSCTDGFTFTQTECMSGMSCVSTNANAVPGTPPSAACMPQGCNPGAPSQCGDKAADPTSTDPTFVSTCSQSAAGYHWTSTKCVGSETCVQGSCVQNCTPGTTRCYANGLTNENGIQTCGQNGTWGATMNCTPTATGQQQVCVTPLYPSVDAPVCGDAVCNGYEGACETDGLHPCVNGKVSATATPCTTGVCVSSTVVNGYNAGSCQAQCNYSGDASNPAHCVGNTAFTSCTSSDRWAATATPCATGTSCEAWTDSNGNQHAICGVCVPGSHRCTDGAGTPGASGPDIETCDSTGQWGAYSACTVGQCGSQNGDNACSTQCVPNSTVCMGGAPATPPNPQHPGTTAWGTCDANGNLPTGTGTACASGTSCRKGANGQTVGPGAAACVQCVGSSIPGGNEEALVDSYCLATANPGSLEVCSSSNTWGTTQACSTTLPANGTCRQESSEFCSGYYYCHNSNYPCIYFWGTGYGSWGGSTDCCATPSCEFGANAPAACD